MKQLLFALAGLLAAFAATTWWALEAGGVAIVETRTPEGGARATHVWYAEPGGELWLEAGAPENPWYRDVQQEPLLELTAGARSGRYRAEPIGDASGHTRIRALMREKYGLRDAWVAFLFDTSRSVAVRLRPASE